MSYQALNLVIHLPMDAQIHLLGGARRPVDVCPAPTEAERRPPNTPWKEWDCRHAAGKEFLRMSEFLFFLIGTMLGGVFGVVMMCLMQINRLSKWRKEDGDAETKRADTFPSDGGRS